MAWTLKRNYTAIPDIHLIFTQKGIDTSINTDNLEENDRLVELDSRSKATKILPGIESNIFSSDVKFITSHDMRGIRETMMAAHIQRKELKIDIASVENDLKKYQQSLKLSYILLYGLTLTKYRTRLKESITNQQLAIRTLNKIYANSYVKLHIELRGDLGAIYDKVYSDFRMLSLARKIWDVTASYTNNKFATRSAADQEIFRHEVGIKTGELSQIRCDYSAMVWQNANGADMYFYPNFVIIWDSNEKFAVIGIDEVDVKLSVLRFLETEDVPNDSKIVDRTWFKVNKNGSADMRFKGNFEIPVVQYAELEIKTSTGLNERYLISNYDAAESFVSSFLEYQIQVIKLEYTSCVNGGSQPAK